MGRYPLPPFPDGWYAVAVSAELARGDVKPLRYLGRDLVLFRGDDGAARVFDAHCPHLGAHLGHGGSVCGDGLRCPFHGWRFDGAGRCVEVPRLERKPPDARVRSYPTLERNGVVLAWWHAGRADPSYEIPEYRTGGGSDWTDWVSNAYQVHTHVQDLGENILDLPHFWNVHDMDAASDRRFEARFEGPRMIVEQTLKVVSGEGPGVEALARTTNTGPGISSTRVTFGPVETLTFLTQTPVDVEHVELHLHFCIKRMENAKAAAAVEDANREFINRQFTQDIPIWNHKIYREKPLLTAIDGPIARYRKWFAQFYSDEQIPT